jgi:hypothetical protein
MSVLTKEGIAEFVMSESHVGTEPPASAKPTRVLAALLTLVLLALLGWSLVRGMGGVSLQLILAGGAFLGSLYTIFGRLPDWIIACSSGYIVADDDPGNISPRIYLSVIGAAILLAVVAVVVVIYVM